MPSAHATHDRFTRLRVLFALTGSLAVLGALTSPAPADASQSQIAIIQDGNALRSDPTGTLATFRALGANTIRLIMNWYSVAPDPASSSKPGAFRSIDPNDYPIAGWRPYDRIVEDAAADGITVDLDVSGGAPIWAQGRDIPPQGRDPHFAWRPDAELYGDFVRAVGERYDGTFSPPGSSSPLPAVRFWTLWNEPNFGEDLGPQAIDGSRVSVGPMMYRNLLSAGWRALHQTGHGADRIVIGEFAAGGQSGPVTRAHPQGLPGDYSQTRPLGFIRTLYCVNSRYQQLRGPYARARGCPASAAGSRRFRLLDPALFEATGVGDHPYSAGRSPVARPPDPNSASFAHLDNLERVLDDVNRVYGSDRRYPIYNDEYGYITRPPQTAPNVSPTTAADYLNWSEYLSWKSPRVASYAQYLLEDPQPGATGGFASGLETSAGRPKATYEAYRLPLYLPRTSLASGDRTEVWGDARPAPFMGADTAVRQEIAIQLRTKARSVFRTIDTVPVTKPGGYFEVRLSFTSGGDVRLAYTYPVSDPLLPPGLAGTSVTSRLVRINVHHE